MVRKILTYMADPSYPALYDKDYANLVNPDGKKQGDDPAEKKGTGRGKKRKKGAGGKATTTKMTKKRSQKKRTKSPVSLCRCIEPVPTA